MVFWLFKRTIGINEYIFSVNNKDVRNAVSELFTKHLKYKKMAKYSFQLEWLNSQTSPLLSIPRHLSLGQLLTGLS